MTNKKVIRIRKTKTPMKRDEGNYELPHVYNDIISTEEVDVKHSDKSFYR